MTLLIQWMGLNPFVSSHISMLADSRQIPCSNSMPFEMHSQQVPSFDHLLRVAITGDKFGFDGVVSRL